MHVRSAAELRREALQLLPDLRLGLALDLAANPAAVTAEAKRNRPDLTALGRVEIDRILAFDPTPRRRRGRGSRDCHGSQRSLLAPLLAPQKAEALS